MKSLAKAVLVADVVLVHVGLVVLGVMVGSTKSQPEVLASTVVAPTPTGVVDICADCRAYVDQRLAKLTVVPTPKPVASLKTVKPTKKRVVQYVTIPGSGESSSNAWAGVGSSDFYFNPDDYPGLIEAYFEANLKLFNGNGRAFVRLIDVSRGIAVQGSEASTTSQAGQIVESGKLSFWGGKSLYRVELRSLTADSAVFGSGRIRVVTEN